MKHKVINFVTHDVCNVHVHIMIPSEYSVTFLLIHVYCVLLILLKNTVQTIKLSVSY